MSTIRAMDDGDTDWAVALLHHWDPSLPRAFWHRVVTGEAAPIRLALVLECDGARRGLAAVNEPEGLPYPLVQVLVEPGSRGQGLGTGLFAAVLPSVAHADAGAGMPDSDAASLAIARHWGFEVLGHGIDSVLDLDAACGPAAVPEGLAVQVVPGSLAVGSGWDVDAFLGRVGDYPESEIYGSDLTSSALLDMAPDLIWVLIVDAGGIVAASSLMPQAEGPWYIGFTATEPRRRGQGLARLAKQAAHAHAWAHGATSVRTTNEERNTRIRALNASMGYRPVSGDLRLVRRVNSR